MKRCLGRPTLYKLLVLVVDYLVEVVSACSDQSSTLSITYAMSDLYEDEAHALNGNVTVLSIIVGPVTAVLRPTQTTVRALLSGHKLHRKLTGSNSVRHGKRRWGSG